MCNERQPDPIIQKSWGDLREHLRTIVRSRSIDQIFLPNWKNPLPSETDYAVINTLSLLMQDMNNKTGIDKNNP